MGVPGGHSRALHEKREKSKSGQKSYTVRFEFVIERARRPLSNAVAEADGLRRAGRRVIEAVGPEGPSISITLLSYARDDTDSLSSHPAACGAGAGEGSPRSLR